MNGESFAAALSFGALSQFTFDPRIPRLYEDGREVEVEPLALQLLRHLLEHRQRYLSDTELVRDVWKSSDVQPTVVKRAIHILRKKLKDDARQPHLIDNVYGRGYRFVGPVRLESEWGVEHRIDYVRFAERAKGTRVRVFATFLYPLTSRASDFQRERFFDALRDCSEAQLLFLDPSSRQSVIRAIERSDDDFFLRQIEMLRTLEQQLRDPRCLGQRRDAIQVRLFDARPSLHLLQAGMWTSGGPYYDDRSIDDSTRLVSTSEAWGSFIQPLFDETWDRARPLAQALAPGSELRLMLDDGAEAELIRALWVRCHAAEAFRLAKDLDSSQMILEESLRSAEVALGPGHESVQRVAHLLEVHRRQRVQP